MDLPNTLETITLNEQTNYRLIEISKIKDYFEAEIKYQQLLTNRLSKCITCFNYADKILTVFLTVFSGTNIFAHVKTKKKIIRIDYFCFFFIVLLRLWCNKKVTARNKNKEKNK